MASVPARPAFRPRQFGIVEMAEIPFFNPRNTGVLRSISAPWVVEMRGSAGFLYPDPRRTHLPKWDPKGKGREHLRAAGREPASHTTALGQ